MKYIKLFENFDQPTTYPAKYMDGMEDVDDLERLLNSRLHVDGKFTERSAEKKREWAESVDLSEPIEVSIGRDGSVLFNDGHHRVLAARILDKRVNIIIKRNEMKPEIFNEFMDRIDRGYSLIEINPDGVNLNYTDNYQIPSLEIMEEARERDILKTGTRLDLFKFYWQKADGII